MEILKKVGTVVANLAYFGSSIGIFKILKFREGLIQRMLVYKAVGYRSKVLAH